MHAGGYWLTSLKSKPLTPAMTLFRDWIVAEAADAAHAPPDDAARGLSTENVGNDGDILGTSGLTR